MAQSSPIPELIELLPGGINGLGESTPSKYFLNILADFKKGNLSDDNLKRMVDLAKNVIPAYK